MKKPNVLIVAPFYPSGPIRFISEAFERMDLKTFRIGATYNDHGGIKWVGDEAVKVDVELKREASRWSIDAFVDLATHAGVSPDLVLMSEENYRTEISPTLKVPSVFWLFDGWPNNYERGDALNPTLRYTSHPYGIRIHPRKEIPTGWKYLGTAHAPWMHPFLNRERDVDFALHATPYGKRPEICDYLRSHGLVVADGWVTTKRYVEDYNRALFTYHNSGGQQEIKYRWYEAAGMGCVNICDHTALYEENGLIAHEHYIPIQSYPDQNGDLWPDPEELLGLIGEYKNITGMIEQLSHNARLEVGAYHTYIHRAQTILEDLGYNVEYS